MCICLYIYSYIYIQYICQAKNSKFRGNNDSLGKEHNRIHICVCKYHSSLLLLRLPDLWSSAQSEEVRTFTHHTNSFLTSTLSSPRRFRPVRGAETLSGVIWTVAVNGPIDPGAEALGVLPRRE